MMLNRTPKSLLSQAYQEQRRRKVWDGSGIHDVRERIDRERRRLFLGVFLAIALVAVVVCIVIALVI